MCLSFGSGDTSGVNSVFINAQLERSLEDGDELKLPLKQEHAARVMDFKEADGSSTVRNTAQCFVQLESTKTTCVHRALFLC